MEITTPCVECGNTDVGTLDIRKRNTQISEERLAEFLLSSESQHFVARVVCEECGHEFTRSYTAA